MVDSASLIIEHGRHAEFAGRARAAEDTAGLLELLDEGGGAVQVKDPPESVRAAWRRLLHAVRQNGEVPQGWHLLHRGRNEGI